MPAVMDLNLLNLVQTYGLDQGIAIYNGEQRICAPGDWLERTNSCENLQSPAKPGDKLSQTFTMGVVFNNATNQQLCNAVVVSKGYLLTTVQGLMVTRGNGSKGILPLSILSVRVDVRKRSYVFPMVSIIFHADKQLALIKLANLATCEILKPIKLIKKTPKVGKTVIMYQSNYPTVLCQYTKVISISGHSGNDTDTFYGTQLPKTNIEKFISIDAKPSNQQQQQQQEEEEHFKITPLIYKNRLMGLMQPQQQMSPQSGQTLVLNILYYSEWIKNNTDYKRK